MTDEVHDTSRLDGYLRARQKVALMNATWRPILAGAVGAALVIGAVWVTLPKISYRDVEVPRVTMRDTVVPNIVQRDVSVDHVVPRDVEIDIPRIVAATPRTPAERAFVDTPDWRAADVRGRILRADKNGFDLATEDGSEMSFFPARIAGDGKVEINEGMKDIVEPFLNDLAACRPMPTGVYLCIAEHEGREIPIKQIPIKPGRPT